MEAVVVEPNKNTKETDAMQTAPSSLNLSPEAQRVLEAGAVATYVFAAVMTVALLGAVAWGLSYALETGNPMALLSLGLLLFLAVPYITVLNANRLLKARRSQG
jgi:hypothetical protein